MDEEERERLINLLPNELRARVKFIECSITMAQSRLRHGEITKEQFKAFISLLVAACGDVVW